MDFKALTAFHRPKRYTLDDFKGQPVETIADLEYDYEYYKREFRDKLDDEFLVLFDLIENADLSKKEVKIMGLMLRKMYEEKYKDAQKMIVLQCEEVKVSTFEPKESEEVEVKVEEVDIEEKGEKEEEKKEYVKESEFSEKHHMGFFEIVQKMEEALFKEDQDE